MAPVMEIPTKENELAAQRIKAVTVIASSGDRHTYRNVARVFTNGDGSVTIMRDSNTPAIARHKSVQGVRYVR